MIETLYLVVFQNLSGWHEKDVADALHLWTQMGELKVQAIVCYEIFGKDAMDLTFYTVNTCSAFGQISILSLSESPIRKCMGEAARRWRSSGLGQEGLWQWSPLPVEPQ